MAAQNGEQRPFLTEPNALCIQQLTDVPGIFALVFGNKVPALLARESSEPLGAKSVIHRKALPLVENLKQPLKNLIGQSPAPVSVAVMVTAPLPAVTLMLALLAPLVVGANTTLIVH